jgi:hypothetical protein
LIINAIGDNKSTTISNIKRCYTIEQCHLTILTTTEYHIINFQSNKIDQFLFSSIDKLFIDYNQINSSLLFSSLTTKKEISTKHCYQKKTILKRYTKSGKSIISLFKILLFFVVGLTSSIIITFNSSSFIDYRYGESLDYPLRLSLRFRTLGRISNGVLLSLTHRKSPSLIVPFIIIEHSNGKIEITILQLDERKVLSTVTVSRPPENQLFILGKKN